MSLVLINPGPSLSLPIVCIISTLQMKEMEAKRYQYHISKDEKVKTIRSSFVIVNSFASLFLKTVNGDSVLKF